MEYIFERYEKKFVITKYQYDLFLEKTAERIKADKYGLHTICNIYYDTDDFELVRRSNEKPVYKEKFRLRSYGIPDENQKVFLELKKKFKGIVYKRRLSMTLKEAEVFLEDGVRPDEKNQIMKEIEYFLDFYKPKKKMFVAYDRTAYTALDDNKLRITVDGNIRSREEDLFLEHGDKGEKLLNDDLYVMEIKTVNAIPLWLTGILSELKIYTTSFSKYGNIYKNRFLLDSEE